MKTKLQQLAALALLISAGLFGNAAARAAGAPAGRVVVPLDGTWTVADGTLPDEIPARFDHSVAVPGLVNQARPAFADVDQYETHEFLYTMARYGVLPATEKCPGLGRTRQRRNYFWHQRTFSVAARRQLATLVIGKAQFGAAVWLNGRKIGEHLGCFTAARFDVTEALNWSGENRLLVRIGAHPGVLPEWALVGTDGEKAAWTPGIYDSVALLLADNPAIESVQVAPRIGAGEIVVQTALKNHGPACSIRLSQRVSTWKGDHEVGATISQPLALAAGEEKLVTMTVPVPHAVLWCPENPFLYVLHTASGGDSCSTRFGMREFRFDTATRRAMLNGRVCFLRGSSITLHRFFGDPQCGRLPWDEAWVRRFLVDLPRQMHWNAFRLCIGPAPQRWLDVADEAGLLLQYEFPIWSDREPFRHKLWKEDEVVAQVREFMRDNWNHPSVALWDASNETHWDFLADTLIPAVRGLDLSGRAWENGYNRPQGPDDPWEDHPYLFIDHCFGTKPPFFQMTDLERMSGRKQPDGVPLSSHAAIINEYDWLWLHRDGTPTILSRKVYDHLLGPQATSAERLELCGYLLGGLTEFWRAHRQYAGVLYLAYLDADRPTAFTCDNFRDVRRLELDPRFADYVGESFKPLGVYVNFWQPRLKAQSARSYRVMLVNDTYEPARGRLELSWAAEDGKSAPTTGQRFELSPLGQMTYDLALTAPAAPGRYVLTAKAYWDGKPWSPTVARRKVAVGK
jgi:hypothetical protein